MKTTADHPAAPVRTYREIAEIMRQRGDEKITPKLVDWHLRQALRKLRVLLREYGEYV